MKIQIITVPYDCGYKEQRQGLGPERFFKHHIDQKLEAGDRDLFAHRHGCL